ncbi:hypothetical protein GO684_04385 [Wolbachia endosymbiont of Litomosoides brasiliensis]|nr:hypothetical protein [Wolbachia endosymbiont of Litomosoides brasiliensis]
MYCKKKFKCCNCSKKHSISSTNCMDKALKLGREVKLFTPPQRCERTRLDQSQFE